MTEQELKECIAEIKNSAIPEQSKKKIINVLYGQMYENGWIPCREHLPDVPEGTEDFFCPEFIVTIDGANEATTLKHSPDSTWFDGFGNIYNVIAWQPLPEVYNADQKGEQISERK